MTLLELFQLLKKHLKLVIALPVVCAIAMGVVSFAMMDNTYTATTSMYILAKTDGGQTSYYNDLSASQMLSNDIATLLDSDSVKSGAAKELGLSNLDDYKVSVTSETTTRVISLSVTGDSPDGAAAVANAIANSVSTVAQDVDAAQAVNVIDKAKAPPSPAAPTASSTLQLPLWPVCLSLSRLSCCSTCSTRVSVLLMTPSSCSVCPLSVVSPS